VQAAVGAGCAALLWAATQRTDLAASALYGAATAVLPSAVLARGMTRKTSANPAAAAIGFMFWEMVKIALAVAMLMAAVRVVPSLSWPALLGVMVVCMKVSWLAMLRQRRPQ
jgi:ATP synthase protein I